MTIYRIAGDDVQPVKKNHVFRPRACSNAGICKKLLRHNIELLVPDAMVLAEEFGDWQDSRRRIDLLCLDRDAGLVVVELKRTEDGGHMELQAIRYAAMVSPHDVRLGSQSSSVISRRFLRCLETQSGSSWNTWDGTSHKRTLLLPKSPSFWRRLNFPRRS